jgi:hypothetical protein
MSKIIYVVENHEGEIEKIGERDILKYVEDNIDDIASLKKKFTPFHVKTIFKMTLFGFDLEFTADEYIDHYSALDPKTYGPNFFTDTDAELIRKLNF